jgi:cobalt/nickel transport system ATP-binding protein
MNFIYELENIDYQYIKGINSLSNISFNVSEGEILSIIGSNGSGKSTLLQILCGLIFPINGQLKYKGDLITEKTLKKPDILSRFRSETGFVFQNTDVQLFCPTVYDELVFGPLQINLTRAEAMERAEAIISMLKIEHLKDRPVYMLSGGERKKVAIGSILTMNPNVIIIDEPMSGLDPKSRAFIIDLLFTLQEVGKTIILATHHLELVSLLQSRVIVLSENHTIRRIGTNEEILNDTEMLVQENLIGEYTHKHNNIKHKHIWYNYTAHNHQ